MYESKGNYNYDARVEIEYLKGSICQQYPQKVSGSSSNFTGILLSVRQRLSSQYCILYAKRSQQFLGSVFKSKLPSEPEDISQLIAVSNCNFLSIQRAQCAFDSISAYIFSNLILPHHFKVLLLSNH